MAAAVIAVALPAMAAETVSNHELSTVKLSSLPVVARVFTPVPSPLLILTPGMSCPPRCPAPAPVQHPVRAATPRVVFTRPLYIPAPSHTGCDIICVLRQAAIDQGYSPDRLVALAACESSFRPWAVNVRSGASGLLQFMPGTWASNGRRFGYGPQDIWNAHAQAEVGAWMLAHGMAYEWACRA
jgi:hypothetical protein